MDTEEIRKTILKAFENGRASTVLRQECWNINISREWIERLRRYCKDASSYIVCSGGIACISEDRLRAYYIGDISSRCVITDRPDIENTRACMNKILDATYDTYSKRLVVTLYSKCSLGNREVKCGTIGGEPLIEFGRDTVSAIMSTVELGSRNSIIKVRGDGKVELVTDNVRLITDVRDLESRSREASSAYTYQLLEDALKIKPRSGRILFRKGDNKAGILELRGEDINMIIAPYLE